MKRVKIGVIAAFLFFLSIAIGRAEDYATSTGRKLGRGLANTALGWTEVLKSVEKTGNEHGPIAGIFWGTLDGIGNAVKRGGAGLIEIATFPIKTSKPLVSPEFPIDKDPPVYYAKDYSSMS